jgi:hypothetical protein
VGGRGGERRERGREGYIDRIDPLVSPLLGFLEELVQGAGVDSSLVWWACHGEGFPVGG